MVSTSHKKHLVGEQTGKQIDILFFLHNFAGGGLEKKVLRLAAMLKERNKHVVIAVCFPDGPLAGSVADGIPVINLEEVPVWKARAVAVRADPGAFGALLRPVLLSRKPPRMLPFLPSLAQLLVRRKPRSLFTAMPYMNVIAVLARGLAGTNTRVVLSEVDAVRDTMEGAREWKMRYLPPLMRREYGRADAVIAVSDGIADDLSTWTGLDRGHITTVYNPTVTTEIFDKASEPLEHPWFARGEPPVVLGVGRIDRKKDFATLIRAFAKVRARRTVRLVILGDASPGRKRDKYLAELAALITSLGVDDDVAFPGFTLNPYSYMRHAAVFVLSSLREGFPNVMVEAMASGCPVVATDCPHGPKEILANETFGPLVPIGDPERMAKAIAQTLDTPIASERLSARASEFSAERAVDHYQRILLGA